MLSLRVDWSSLRVTVLAREILPGFCRTQQIGDKILRVDDLALRLIKKILCFRLLLCQFFQKRFLMMVRERVRDRLDHSLQQKV